MNDYRIVTHKLVFTKPQKASPIERISTPEEAAAFVRSFFKGADRESAYVCCTDAKYRVLTMERISMGARGMTYIDIPAVFKTALCIGAAFCFVFHNHLSEDPTPSQSDIDITERIEWCGTILSVPLKDHIIISSSGDYRSMKKLGYIKEMQDKKLEGPYEKADKYKESYD